jgi:hypothetical protein
VFSYHLRSLITEGLVGKTADGQYALTSSGKLFGVNNNLTKSEKLEQAHSIVLLAVRNRTGDWLLRRRTVQPQFNKIGFIHGEPVAGQPVIKTANIILKRRTGLTATWAVKGSGLISMQNGEQLESFVHYVLLVGRKPEGSLIPKDKHGQNFWEHDPDFAAPDMIGTMLGLVRAIQQRGLFHQEFIIKD